MQLNTSYPPCRAARETITAVLSTPLPQPNGGVGAAPIAMSVVRTVALVMGSIIFCGAASSQESSFPSVGDDRFFARIGVSDWGLCLQFTRRPPSNTAMCEIPWAWQLSSDGATPVCVDWEAELRSVIGQSRIVLSTITLNDSHYIREFSGGFVNLWSSETGLPQTGCACNLGGPRLFRTRPFQFAQVETDSVAIAEFSARPFPTFGSEDDCILWWNHEMTDGVFPENLEEYGWSIKLNVCNCIISAPEAACMAPPSAATGETIALDELNSCAPVEQTNQ
jgi:hypothetical protein